MPSAPLHEITKREADVAVALGRGLSYKEVATELGVSASTVRHVAERLADKFDGHMTPGERARGPRYLITTWVSRLAGEMGRAQTAEELMLECVEALVRLRLALDEAARRSTPTQERRRA